MALNGVTAKELATALAVGALSFTGGVMVLAEPAGTALAADPGGPCPTPGGCGTSTTKPPKPTKPPTPGDTKGDKDGWSNPSNPHNSGEGDPGDTPGG